VKFKVKRDEVKKLQKNQVQEHGNKVKGKEIKEMELHLHPITGNFKDGKKGRAC